MRGVLGALWLMTGWLLGQTGTERSPAGLSDLPSVDAKAKLPGLEESAPSPDLGGVVSPSSPSVPQLRPPEREAEKSKDQDWAAQGMLQKKEAAKKREEEQAALAEKQSRESQQDLEKSKSAKSGTAPEARQPVVAKSAVPGFGDGEVQKLPAVTGLDGVKPRAMASGDGRVQPSFDSFTGPSGTGPLGKDFQSGAKPIMPGSATAEGRMQLPPTVPEPPSGGYKRISQDPYTLPPGFKEKTANPPSAPKPVVIPPKPSVGDTKRVINDGQAGYSPYDNSKKVPDPRSQRRF